MHRVCAERARDRANAGMAITANSPITATTIMISTKVNPGFLEARIFIPENFLLSRRGPGSRRVIISSALVHGLPAAAAHVLAALSMPAAWVLIYLITEIHRQISIAVQDRGIRTLKTKKA